MKKGLVGLGVLVGLVILFGLYLVGGRNSLVTLDENVNEKWAQVQNVYQRRADLIPNLVQTVKGYAAHERQTLTDVVEARAKATQFSPQVSSDIINNPQAFAQFQQAQDQLSSALSRLMVVVERYPDLKANESFLSLQSQLEGSENRITVERQRYNEAAKEFNVAVRQFPRNIIASLFGFERKAFFQAAAGVEQAPKVEF